MESNLYLKFVLNGVEIVNLPDGWEQMEITLEEDDDVKGLLFSYSSRLTFWGDGFEIIRDSFFENLCLPVTCDIYRSDNSGQYELINNFLIFTNDDSNTVFDFTKQEVSTQLEDVSFASKINNNKNIKANIKSNLSKNGVEIVPVPDWELQLHNITTGSYSDYPGRTAYWVNDIFRWFVEWMSDGELSFQSTYFSNNYIMICLGEQLRATTGDLPAISYLDFFENVTKLLNVSFRIENKVVIIEPTDDLFSESLSITLSGIDSIQTGIDNSKLYAQILVGDSEYNETEGFFPNYKFLGFAEESFYFLGNCNNSDDLDLKPDWVFNSNAIQYALGGNNSRDKDIFFIHADAITPAIVRSIGSLLFGSPYYFYNSLFRNSNVIERGAGGLGGSLAFYNGNIDGFRIKSGYEVFVGTDVNITDFGPSITPPPENLYNDGGNFNLVVSNSYYNVPTGGFYSFGAYLNFTLQETLTFVEGIVTFRIKRFDSSNVFIENIFEESVTYSVGNVKLYIEKTINSDVVLLDANDRIKYFIELQLGVGPGSTFLTTQEFGIEPSLFYTNSTEAGGGIYKEFGFDTTRILTNQFNFFLSKQDWDTIFSNTDKRIRFESDLYSNAGWIKRISWNPVTSEAKFNLVSYGF